MALRCRDDVTAGCGLLDDGTLLVPVPMPTPYIRLVAHYRSPEPLLASMPNQRDGRLDRLSPSNKAALGGGIHSFGLFIRTIGLARAEAKLTLANLAYNFDRLIFHERASARG